MDKYSREFFQACGRIGGLRKRPITSEEARDKANKRWEAYRAQKEKEAVK